MTKRKIFEESGCSLGLHTTTYFYIGHIRVTDKILLSDNMVLYYLFLN